MESLPERTKPGWADEELRAISKVRDEDRRSDRWDTAEEYHYYEDGVRLQWCCSIADKYRKILWTGFYVLRLLLQ